MGHLITIGELMTLMWVTAPTHWSTVLMVSTPIQWAEFIHCDTRDSSFLKVIEKKKKRKPFPACPLLLFCPETLTHIVANHRKGDIAQWGKIGRITKNLSSFESCLYFYFGSTNNHKMYPAFTQTCNKIDPLKCFSDLGAPIPSDRYFLCIRCFGWPQKGF